MPEWISNDDSLGGIFFRQFPDLLQVIRQACALKSGKPLGGDAQSIRNRQTHPPHAKVDSQNSH